LNPPNLVWCAPSFYTNGEYLVDFGYRNGELTSDVKGLLQPSLDGLNELANQYCENDNFVSPNLEWALVSSMFYLTTVNILEEIKQQDGGVKRAVVLSYFPLSFVAAFVVNAKWLWIAWVLFSGLFLFVLSEANRLQKKEAEKKALSNDMIEILRNPLSDSNFNGRQIRRMLSSIEGKGIIFPSAVFNVLDKRIARGA